MKEDLGLGKRISSQLTLILIIVLGCLLFWFLISEAGKIISNSKNSPAFNLKKREETEFPSVKANNSPNETNDQLDL